MLQILIADDEVELCELMQDILSTELVCQVDTAHDGLAALKATQDKSYDLVITDYKMPELNGEQLIQKIRQNDNPSSKAVVFLISGHHEAGQSPQDQVHYFNKPLSIERIIDLIRETVPK